MPYYHGSPTGHLTTLLPCISEHKEAFVYFSTNIVVATFYCVKIGFYPYGFEKDSSLPIYTEYYPECLSDIYKGKHGFIYSVPTLSGEENPTLIRSATVSRNPVKIESMEHIPDVYTQLLAFEQEQKLRIIRYSQLSDHQKAIIKSQIQEEIKTQNLLMKKNTYSQFIESKFPDIWRSYKTSIE